MWCCLRSFWKCCGSTGEPVARSVGFFREIHRKATTHLEIETYTFDVLPKQIHPGDIVRSISRFGARSTAVTCGANKRMNSTT